MKKKIEKINRATWLERCQNNNLIRSKSLGDIYLFLLENPNMLIDEKTEILKDYLLRFPDNELKQFLKIFLSQNHLPIPQGLFENQVMICRAAADIFFNQFRLEAFAQVFSDLFDIAPSNVREGNLLARADTRMVLTNTTITIWDEEEERDKEMFAFYFNNNISICDIYLQEVWPLIEINTYVNHIQWSRDECLFVISQPFLIKYDIDGNELWRTHIVPENDPRLHPLITNIVETRDDEIIIGIEENLLWIAAQHGAILREMAQQNPIRYIAEGDAGILCFLYGFISITLLDPDTGITTDLEDVRPSREMAYSSSTHLMGTVSEYRFFIHRINETPLEINPIFEKDGTYREIAFSHDGTLVAVSLYGSIAVYNIETKTLWKRLVLPTQDHCRSILFSSDGSMVVATTTRNALLTWNLYGAEDAQLRALLSGIDANPKDYYADTVMQVMRRVSAKQRSK